MYITTLEKEYLPLVADLESKSYPEKLVLGVDYIWQDIENNSYLEYSRIAFSNGELVGYILAYKEDIYNKDNTVYISDLNCQNPRYLKRILLSFFGGGQEIRLRDTVCEAHFRANSYHLLCNQQKKNNGLIQILEDVYMPEYYDNGETAHHVKFKVNINSYLQNSWKDSFLYHLDRFFLNSYRNIMKYSISFLESWIEREDLYNKKNMNFIIRNLKDSVIDYYKMYDDKIEGWFNCLFSVRNTMNASTGFEKTISELQRRGYEERGADKGYVYNWWNGKLQITKKVIVFNTKYRDALSGYRWLRKREMKYLKKTGKDAWFIYSNKYGVKHEMIKVPYLTERNYLYYLNKLNFKKQILSRLQLREDVSSREFYSFDPFFDHMYNLLRSKDAQKCINSIVERMKPNTSNYFHDWLLIVDDLYSARSILTDGAITSVLCGSYNQALYVTKNIMAIKQNLLDDKRVVKLFNIKELRKKISKLIRNRKECTSYVREISEYVTQYYSSRFQMSAADKQKIPEYMNRVQKYNAYATFCTLYRMFGKKCLSKFLKGTYPCVFKPKELYPSYNCLAEFVLGVLRKGSAQSRHVYGKLKKEGLLEVIDTGCITSTQYETILQILKKHNVKIEDDVIIKLRDFKICIEPKGSPEFLTAGDASVCCMSLGSEKIIDYAKEEGFGIVNIYYRDRVIANSVIWINEPYQCLVLDNIEVHPNYLKFRKLLEISFYTVAEYIMLQYELRFVVQGVSFNDLQLYQEEDPLNYFDLMIPIGVHTEDFYSDASYFKVIMKRNQEVSLEELIQIEEELEFA